MEFTTVSPDVEGRMKDELEPGRFSLCLPKTLSAATSPGDHVKEPVLGAEWGSFLMRCESEGDLAQASGPASTKDLYS